MDRTFNSCSFRIQVPSDCLSIAGRLCTFSDQKLLLLLSHKEMLQLGQPTIGYLVKDSLVMFSTKRPNMGKKRFSEKKHITSNYYMYTTSYGKHMTKTHGKQRLQRPKIWEKNGCHSSIGRWTLERLHQRRQRDGTSPLEARQQKICHGNAKAMGKLQKPQISGDFKSNHIDNV